MAGPCNWVRSYTIATGTGRKRVTTVANPFWPGDPANPALGHTTTYTYDDMGRLIGTSSPDSGTTTYGYRAEGTLVWRIDARGIRTDYTSDLLYRINQASYPSAGDLGAYTVTYSHDQRANGKGHLTTVTDRSLRIRWVAMAENCRISQC